MAYKITYTERFKKHYKTLNAQEQKQILNKLHILSENPNYPSLRTKRIQGTDNLYESSINMDIRIIWYFEDNLLIFLVDVGHHDILKQF